MSFRFTFVILGLNLSGCAEFFNADGVGDDLPQVINDYRVDQGLDEIPISDDLMIVAETHIEDLFENSPAHGKCNLHSWSNQGDWSGCCYTDDHAQAECMWQKPGELSDYTGSGYEIAAQGVSTAKGALSTWKSSELHHDVIVQEGMWSDNDWIALGAAVGHGYAVAWFGDE